jgi:hypothetical protein
MAKRINPSFNPASQSASKKLQQVAGARITGLTEAMRETVMDTVREGLARGEAPGTIALELVGRINKSTGKREGGLIGLNRPQAAAVRSYRARLASGNPTEMRKTLNMGLRDRRLDKQVRKAAASGKKLPKEFIDKAVAKYANASLKLRGETIARTETGAIVLAGNQESFRQTSDKAGLGDNAIVRTWRTAGDEKVRHTHEEMDGVKVYGMSKPYRLPDGDLMMHPMDGSLGAKASNIINCRCDEEITVDYSVGLDDEETPVESNPEEEFVDPTPDPSRVRKGTDEAWKRFKQETPVSVALDEASGMFEELKPKAAAIARDYPRLQTVNEALVTGRKVSTAELESLDKAVKDVWLNRDIEAYRPLDSRAYRSLMPSILKGELVNRGYEATTLLLKEAQDSLGEQGALLKLLLKRGQYALPIPSIGKGALLLPRNLHFQIVSFDSKLAQVVLRIVERSHGH